MQQTEAPASARKVRGVAYGACIQDSAQGATALSTF